MSQNHKEMLERLLFKYNEIVPEEQKYYIYTKGNKVCLVNAMSKLGIIEERVFDNYEKAHNFILIDTNYWTNGYGQAIILYSSIIKLKNEIGPYEELLISLEPLIEAFLNIDKQFSYRQKILNYYGYNKKEGQFQIKKELLYKSWIFLLVSN